MAAAKKPKAGAKSTALPKARTPAEKLDAFGVDAFCEAIKDGDSMRAIAAKVGVEPVAMRQWLAADETRSARVREARSAAAMTYDEMALQGISDARDPFELARAKEEAHHLRWRASKINPREYGDKVAVGGDADAPPIRSESRITMSAEEAYKRMLGGG